MNFLMFHCYYLLTNYNVNKFSNWSNFAFKLKIACIPVNLKYFCFITFGIVNSHDEKYLLSLRFFYWTKIFNLTILTILYFYSILLTILYWSIVFLKIDPRFFFIAWYSKPLDNLYNYQVVLLYSLSSCFIIFLFSIIPLQISLFKFDYGMWFFNSLCAFLLWCIIEMINSVRDFNIIEE